MRAELIDGTVISVDGFDEQDRQEAQNNLKILEKGGTALFAIQENSRMDKKLAFMKANNITRFLD